MATKVQEGNKTRKRNKLRYAEYYGQQKLLDRLYQGSKEGQTFENLMPLITSRENILQAYRSIKQNVGSETAGTDGKTIRNIEALPAEEVQKEILHRLANYYPNAVRRVEIPKPNGKTRPLGIPSIWDRLIQQCILQIMEPICEAKFSDNSYGFRPLRSTEHAIAHEMKLINQSKLHFVVEIDIKGFFDNVHHDKLIRQIWSMGIHDEKLLSVIEAILNAPIRMLTGELVKPDKGTPQGGILSPLLANIVLNELDSWIDSQWENNPVTQKYAILTNLNGSADKSSGFRAMKKTNLKEMHIIRYADDVRILCRTRSQADKTMIAVKQFLSERLKLQTSEEKTRVVNIKKHSSEFLGFEIRVRKKADKLVAKSRMGQKAMERTKQKLKRQIKAIKHPDNEGEQVKAICNYNAMVRGVHNYFQIATECSVDFGKIGYEINVVMKSRLKALLRKEGRFGVKSQDYKRYGKSDQVRFIGATWILPIAYVQAKNPMCKRRKANAYTQEGRQEVHDELRIANKYLMTAMSKSPITNRSVEYNDNRLSLFAAQYGRCAVTGKEFLTVSEIRCHHKTPISKGGNDRYANLILVREDVHILIHATRKETIERLLAELKLTQERRAKLNELRKMAGCEPV